MKKAYPCFIKKSGKTYLVYVPDLKINTEGKDIADAIEMARDAIGLKCVSLDDEGLPLPVESDMKTALQKTKADTDDIFDYSDGIETIVDVDVTFYRNKSKNRAVRKNCTIPAWLNDKAELNGINFSKVLTDALIEILGYER